MGAELEGLEKKIAALEGQVFSLRSELEKIKRAPATAAATLPPKAEIAKPEPAKQAPGAVPKVAAAPSKPAPAIPAGTAAPDSGFSWEWLIGGNIIGKIGIVTLIVSTALFMVYALDQGWLSEWVRLLMLQGVFAFLSYLSYRLYQKQYKYIPEILAITALAANTIAIYSAHFIYRFLGRIETMTMMFALMAIALGFARRIRSTALIVILFAGFFALPVIHSRGINEPGAYFAYLLAVNVLFLILQKISQAADGAKPSPHTIWVLTLGNALSLFGWAGTYEQYSFVALSFCAITLVVLLFAAHAADWDSRTRAFFSPAAIIVINFFYAFMTASALALNKAFTEEAYALALLGQAAVNYLAVQFLAAPRRHLTAAALMIVLLMAVGVSVLMHGPLEKLLIAVLLTAAMALAARSEDGLLYYGVAMANAVNVIGLLVMLTHANNRWFLLNFQAACFFFYAGAAIYLRMRRLWPQRFNFGAVLTAVALVMSFIGILSELQRAITGKDARLIMITLVFAGYALVLLFIGFRWQRVWFRQAGLFFMGLAIAKFYFVDIWQWDKSVRIIAGIIMGGGLVLISFYYEKFRGKFKEMGAVLLLAGILMPAQPAEAAEKFKPNRFKFVKELSPASSAERTGFGRVLIDAELYRSAGENDLRLSWEGKVLPYVRQMKKTGDEAKIEKEIPVADLVTSVDGENTSIFIFENRDRLRMSGIKIHFKEKDYSREIKVFQKAGKFTPSTLAKTVTLTRKAGKPESHLVDFAPVSGEIHLQISNEDDAALTLARFAGVSDKEYLVFKIPENFSESQKAIQLFYGGEYAQKPKYDISDAVSEATEYADFTLGAEKANPQHKLTLFDPPYSVWFFRTVFWLLLALIAWRMYTVYRKEKVSAA